VQSALNYLASLQSEGGTMMLKGIKAALDFPHDPRRLRFICFMTDGYIGNEREILGEIRKSLGPSRIFSFGVGSSPNRYLLDHMAKIGNGAVAYLSLQDNAEAIMAMFLDRISYPALTDISIDFGSLRVSDVYPRRIPDLFVGRPVIVTGRFTGSADGVIRVRGFAGSEAKDILVPICTDQPAPGHQSLAAIWARNKIADLADRSGWNDSPDLPDQIKQVALEYGLMSPYTSFIAVDSLTRTAGDHGVTVNVPVPVPDGVKYETTVQNRLEVHP
jgi:Ca-activated chloride channel family protein